MYPDVVDRVHQDFLEMTPPDVNLLIATRMWSLAMMHAERFDPVSFARHRQEILDAATELGTYQQGVVDFVMVSGDLIQSAMGPDWDRELSAAIAAAAGRPATTSMIAVSDALGALQVDRVAVITPFRDEQNEYIRAYLVACGFEVPVIAGVHTTTTNEIRELAADSAYNLAVATIESDRRADCVYVACPAWRGVSKSIDPLERRLRVPVVTTFSAILWKALSALSHGWHGASYGRLLASLGHGKTSPPRGS